MCASVTKLEISRKQLLRNSGEWFFQKDEGAVVGKRDIEGFLNSLEKFYFLTYVVVTKMSTLD